MSDGGEGQGPGLPAGEVLAERIDGLLTSGAIGHSSASHAVHGWCSVCKGRTLHDEVSAWRHHVQVEAAITRPARAQSGVSTIVVDFDGPLHDYLEGWGDGSVYGKPVEGSREALGTLMAGFAVVIGTARTDLAAVAEAIRRWYGIQTVIDTPTGRCVFWNVRGAVLVTNRKLPAVAYIDDRAYRWWPPGGGENFGWTPVLQEVIGDHTWCSSSSPVPFQVLAGSEGKTL